MKVASTLASLPVNIAIGVALTAVRIADPNDHRTCDYCGRTVAANHTLTRWWVNDLRMTTHRRFAHLGEQGRVRDELRHHARQVFAK